MYGSASDLAQDLLAQLRVAQCALRQAQEYAATLERFVPRRVTTTAIGQQANRIAEAYHLISELAPPQYKPRKGGKPNESNR